MQTKMMEMYREHGVSPFSSCLPLLIQMPIFIAFYQSLLNFPFSVAEHASFLWIPNIGERDPYLLLAVLAAVTTFYQSRLSTVNAQDPTQKTMLYIMPLFMAWIAATLPAGLPLYWVTFNILGILQQLYVNRTSRLAVETGVGVQVKAQETVEDNPDQENKEPAPVEKAEKKEVKGNSKVRRTRRKEEQEAKVSAGKAVGHKSSFRGGM